MSVSEFKYKNGDMVSYDCCGVTGQAIVIGVATNGDPLIGRSYILKDQKIKSDVYPYECFVCPELYIKDDIRVGGTLKTIDG